MIFVRIDERLGRRGHSYAVCGEVCQIPQTMYIWPECRGNKWCYRIVPIKRRFVMKSVECNVTR